MKLILTRHGETEENKNKILQGHRHGTLSSLGKKQAEKLALRLKTEKIDQIYTSDLGRALNTAKAIAQHHPEVSFHITKKLRERDMGEYEGKPWDKVNWNNPPKNLEPDTNLRKRAKAFIDSIYKKHPNKTVLAVAHAGINLAITTAILHKPAKEINKLGHQANTAVNIYELKEDKNHKIILFNCDKHLE
ncbi:histidine phosphatase family protein [Candidatus Woesearchaeota archaeon]|nr:histidine phosphatase family protein [Candidatus Woesearchaeota archaeon]|tara:strand:- start:2170 stop:2739 length:570 start_codon:yes stop_codon:yes gene_type:complete